MRPCFYESASGDFGVEGALLWSIRAWVADCTGPDFIASGDRIPRLWSDYAMPMVAGYIDGMMWALARGKRRTLQICCLGMPEVSADEAVLLSAVAKAQTSRNEFVVSKLSAMVMPGAAVAICDGAHRIRCALTAKGYVLPQDEATLLERVALSIFLQSNGSASPYLH